MTQEPVDIVLVQPPFGGEYNFWKSECLGLGYLAAALERNGYTVKILDAFLLDLSIEETVRRIVERRPRLMVGTSMLSYQLYRTGTTVLDRLREEGLQCHFTAGSWFPTFWHDAMIDEGTPLDSIVVGEGEAAICAVADQLSAKSRIEDRPGIRVTERNGVLVLQEWPPTLDLDSLPNPRRDYLPHVFKRYRLATIHTARGCGHNTCTFCSVPAFYHSGPAHRMRSAENVVNELRDVREHGADFVFFSDEDFLGKTGVGRDRALRIFEAAADLGMRYSFNCTVTAVEAESFRRMKDLGLAAVYIGLEAHNDRCLKLFGKGGSARDVDRTVALLRDLDIKLVPGWIMFERDSTFEEIEEAIQFLSRIDAYHINFLRPLYVMKDTALEKRYSGDLYRPPFDSKFYYTDPNVDLLVRVLTTDYLPEVLPFTNLIYPVWHTLLAGYGNAAQQGEYEEINRRMKELGLGFTKELMDRIRAGRLDGTARALAGQVDDWRRLGVQIAKLANGLCVESTDRPSAPGVCGTARVPSRGGESCAE